MITVRYHVFRPRLLHRSGEPSQFPARAVLSGRATAIAKSGDGEVEMVRMFKLAKASAIKSRGQAINQLKAVLAGADPTLRESLAGMSNPRLFRRCAELGHQKPADPASAAAYTLRLLARRIIEPSSEIDELNQHITAAITTRTPMLLQRYQPGGCRQDRPRGRDLWAVMMAVPGCRVAHDQVGGDLPEGDEWIPLHLRRDISSPGFGQPVRLMQNEARRPPHDGSEACCR